MEHIFDALKDMILSELPARLEALEDESTPLRPPAEKDVIFGTVDLSKIRSPLIVAIVPESQSDEESETGAYSTSTNLSVSFICSTVAKTETRIRQICRYGAAFRRMVLDDPSLGGRVLDTGIGERQFFPDVGTAPGQTSIIEISLTVLTDEESDDAQGF